MATNPSQNSLDPLDRIHTTLQYMLAAQYTRRYQEIVTNIPPQILFHNRPMELEDWKSVASVIHAYIDLCAEELRLYNADQIPEQVWQNWEEGIQAGMRKPAVQVVWQEYFKKGPYDELRRYLDGKERDG